MDRAEAGIELRSMPRTAAQQGAPEMTSHIDRIEAFLFRSDVREPVKTSFGSIPWRSVLLLHGVPLTGSYTLEGAGYIVAGTFLLAAVAGTGPAWLSEGVWVLVGLAALPSCALWSALSR
jgi:hypothetical protein